MSVPTDNNKSVKEFDEEIQRPGNKALQSKTDRKIKRNRPDLVVKDYKRKTCFLIDMSVPTDNNKSVKEYNEISK